ncbi:MAG TPA: hydrogenase maturation protease, partial [Trebonia sp.]
GLFAGPAGVLACELAVIGCGDPQRSDDGVGPLLVRRLREDGTPPGVRLVDGGTAGADVAWQMRGAKRVIVVDSGRTGAAPGTVYRVPGPEVADMPPLSGLHTHSFRWDHSLAFARWLLGPRYPADVTVYLIEALDQTPGDELSAPARDGLTQVLGLIRRESAFRAPGPGTAAASRPSPEEGTQKLASYSQVARKLAAESAQSRFAYSRA